MRNLWIILALVFLAGIVVAEPVDTIKFYPTIDTTAFQRIEGKWTPTIDTIWKPKISVWLTPAEYDKLMELLHPKWDSISAYILPDWLREGTVTAIDSCIIDTSKISIGW
jgi:hypothetical protein